MVLPLTSRPQPCKSRELLSSPLVLLLGLPQLMLRVPIILLKKNSAKGQIRFFLVWYDLDTFQLNVSETLPAPTKPVGMDLPFPTLSQVPWFLSWYVNLP